MSAATVARTAATDDTAEEVESESESTLDSSTPLPTDVVDSDTVFGLLKNSRRREVLRFLRAEGGSSTLRAVAEHVAALENDCPVGAITSKQRKRVYVSLYQVHLPGMDRAGMIDFERNRGTIELLPRADALFSYLDDETTGESRFAHYLTVTALGGLLYGFGSLLLGPASPFVTATVAGLIVAVLGLAALDHRERFDERDAGTGPATLRGVSALVRTDGGATPTGDAAPGTEPGHGR